MTLSLEQVKTQAQPWLAPIRPDAPAGVASKELPAYQRVVGEVEKLERPDGGAVSWKLVVEEGGELLKSQSKDLRIAAFFAVALHTTQGLPGLVSGVVVLSELIETYWPTLFPELTRLRGRANALGWFVTRTANTLNDYSPRAQDRETVEALAQAVTRLVEVSKKSFNGEGPAMAPLTDALKRLELSLPAAAPASPPPGATAAPASVSGGVAAPAVAAVKAPDAASPDAVIEFTRALGAQLVPVAAALRRAQPEEALGYRLLRNALWTAIAAAPPAEASGRTKVPAPPPAMREKLEKLAANGKWLELIDEAESLLPQQRLWLDLNRFTAQALAGLGPSHAAARAAVVAETAHLLRRLSGLDSMAYADGSPSADATTRKWLEAEASSAPSAGSGRASGLTSEDDATPLSERLEEAKGLIRGGRAAEGVTLFQEAVRTAGHGETRFSARLAFAEACSTAGQTELARALYAALDAEGREISLDSWNPPLAAKCIQGLITATRQSKKPRGPLEAELDALYKRLCQIDPAAALRLGP